MSVDFREASKDPRLELTRKVLYGELEDITENLTKVTGLEKGDTKDMKSLSFWPFFWK